jgi:glycosyltransferase involved in cell wall biosynthesis
MTVTVAISTYEGHRNLLPGAIESAQGADEILIIDNGWSCMGLSNGYHYFGRTPNKSIAESRNVAIDHASGDYLIYLDADDRLTRIPDDLVGDWCYADLWVTDADGKLCDRWDYSGFPRERNAARDYAAKNLSLPTPMKAGFRLEWLQHCGVRWQDWPHVMYSEDTLMCLRLHDVSPDIRYIQEPFYSYRYTPGHHPGAELFHKDLLDYLSKGESWLSQCARSARPSSCTHPEWWTRQKPPARRSSNPTIPCSP